MIKNIILLILVLAVSGCANMKKVDQAAQDVEQRGEKWKSLSRSKTVEVTDEPFLGAKSVPLNSLGNPVLDRKVTFKRKGSLSAVATAIGELVGVPVQVYQDEETKKATQPAQEPRQSQPPISSAPVDPSIDMKLEALLSGGGAGSGVSPLSSGQISVSYEGTFRGVLDQVASQSGYGWDFDDSKGMVIFAKTLVKTFVLQGAPGKVVYDNRLTNKSKDLSSSTGMNSNIGQTVQTADTSTQTAQTNTSALAFDIWVDTEHAVKALLSPKGSVVINQVAGTITVRDAPQVLRQVSSYIDDVNARISRQVALTIQVWQLTVSDSLDASVDLMAIFAGEDVRVVAGSLVAGGGDLGTAAATIVSGKLKGATAVVKALRQWGKASQVTSAGGLAMSNQPIPAMAIERTAYLAGVGTSQTNVANTTMVQPGEVTTGFSMTVVPHILDQRRVVLQYNVNISSLESMQEFKTSDIKVQLPQVSTQAFSQRATLKMGQTLVLSGFEKEKNGAKNSVGIPTLGHNSDNGKTLLVITISVESGDA